MRKLSRGLLKAEILLWNMGTGLKEKWRRAAQDESGLDVIITVALIAVMLIVAGSCWAGCWSQRAHRLETF